MWHRRLVCGAVAALFAVFGLWMTGFGVAQEVQTPKNAENKAAPVAADDMFAELNFGGGDAGIGGGKYPTGFTIVSISRPDAPIGKLVLSAAFTKDHGRQSFRVVAEDKDGKRYLPMDPSGVSGMGSKVGVTTVICEFELPLSRIEKLVLLAPQRAGK